MAVPQSSTSVPQDTLITIKITVNDSLKKLKLPLRDLTAAVLPDKLRYCLSIKPEDTVVFERFSDSAGGYIVLDANNPQVFKTLMRAAKAKLKLRLKATVTSSSIQSIQAAQDVQEVDSPKRSEAEQPTIVHSPVYPSAPRDSVAMDCRTVGHNIFKFREARAAQQNPTNDEAPLPMPFTSMQKDSFELLARTAAQQSLPVRVRENNEVPSAASHIIWTIYCNECDAAMEDAHFHCSICDGGDYDLCEKCVAEGKLCKGEDHWLVKRFIQDGKVANSTTTRVGRKVPEQPTVEEKEVSHGIPGAFQDEVKTLTEETREPTRTCNSCVIILPEHEFVTCTDCDDYDLCIDCFRTDKHGHHPGHAFDRATEKTILPAAAGNMLTAGRGVRHHAICDGCDKTIYGVRHKCLTCPDWDYCNECVKGSKTSHPRHRFATLFTPIPDTHGSAQRHYGIYCDGPLCVGKQTYIRGTRYKCAVCHDTDFCGSCEALPTHQHNRTHPLIKFKTPVRNASIQTSCEDTTGSMRTLGDRSASPPNVLSSSQATALSPCVATPVHTVADIKPTETQETPASMSVTKLEQVPSVHKAANPEVNVPAALLNAHFIRDSVPDGMTVKPGTSITQVWTLKNPGPYVWPAGCSVRYVGGDNMLNLDNTQIASAVEVAEATESNVVGREVNVGEEVAFKIALKAPTREGKCISYWRLKAADGTPFGHRLWCDVEVKAEKLALAPTPACNVVPLRAWAEQLQNDLQARQSLFQQNMMHQQQMSLDAQREKGKHQQTSPSMLGGSTSQGDIASRVAHMRQAQQARREQLMAQFNAQREQSLAPDTTKPVTPLLPIIGTSDQQKGSSMLLSAADLEKSRREAAKIRAEALKAKILKAREIQAKAVEAEMKASEARALASPQTHDDDHAAAADVVKIKESPVEEDIEHSQMVFPRLEKESPSSSTYASATASTDGSKAKVAYVENEEGEIERSAQPALSVSSPVDEKDDFEDLTDDLEVFSAHEDDVESDGFLTDEEYDILDASDRETVASH